MRLSLLLETVLGIALGLGLARDKMPELKFFQPEHLRSWMSWADEPVESGFAGFGLVLGLGTWIETEFRRGATPWGAGRWSLSVVALYILIRNGMSGLNVFSDAYRHHHRNPFEAVIEDWQSFTATAFLSTVPWFLVALWCTRRIARPGASPPADGRERVGQAYVVLLLCFATLWQAADVLGFMG